MTVVDSQVQGCEPATRANLRGLGIVAVAMAFWAAVFYLVTVRFRTLP
ncbi:hypothetical protein [Streptomyces sp. NPDC048720]